MTGLCCYWSGKAFLIFSYILECVRSLLTECDIVFKDEHAPSREHVLGTIFEVFLLYMGVAAIFVI